MHKNEANTSIRLRTHPALAISALSELPGESRERVQAYLQSHGLTHVAHWLDAPNLPACGLTPTAAKELLELKNPRGREIAPQYFSHAKLRDLVLMDQLQIEVGDQFLGGPFALSQMEPQFEALAAQCKAADEVSYAALRYAQELCINDPQTLTARIYFYHRVPYLPGGTNGSSIQRYLGQVEAILANHGHGKVRVRASLSNEDFLFLSAGDPRSLPPHSEAAWKLYICPHPEALPSVLRLFLAWAETQQADLIKIARNAGAACRPDKLIVYGRTRSELETQAASLIDALRTFPVQRLPFTHPLEARGMVALGRDPPCPSPRIHGTEPESWRVLVCRHIASALLLARTRGSPVEPWKFAVSRLHHQGINCRTWLRAHDGEFNQ